MCRYCAELRGRCRRTLRIRNLRIKRPSRLVLAQLRGPLPDSAFELGRSDRAEVAGVAAVERAEFDSAQDVDEQLR